MSRTKNTTLKTAKKYSNLLLYIATGGIIGTDPGRGKKVEGITFAEKKGLLTELLKLAELEHKHKPGDDDESPFVRLKRGVKDGSKANTNGGSEGDGGERPSDDTEDSDSF